MKKLATLLGFVAISLTANGEVQLASSQTQYCSKHGSVMTVRKADNNKFEMFLKKNGMSFTLLAPVGTISIGGQADIQEKQDLLISKNLIANGELVMTEKSYSFSTVLSNESTIKALNILSEITVASGVKIGVLYSNDGLIFMGAENLCPQLIVLKPLRYEKTMLPKSALEKRIFFFPHSVPVTKFKI